MHSQRAILFDLDDTLYPYRAFLRSGFRAVSGFLAERHGIPACDALRTLRQAFHRDRGRELQALCARFALPESTVFTLAALMREHAPVLRLPAATAGVLRALKRDADWRIGILTNGSPDVQRRKIAALGIGELVDRVFCAVECGDERGKPAPVVFRTALARMKAGAASSVFVGNDPIADIEGANAAGLKAIHITAHQADPACDVLCQGIHVSRIEQVPQVADQLVPRNEYAL
jgi:putative hydrolase of the HAD superfamily